MSGGTETAGILGIPLGTAGSRLRLARARLTRELRRTRRRSLRQPPVPVEPHAEPSSLDSVANRSNSAQFATKKAGAACLHNLTNMSIKILTARGQRPPDGMGMDAQRHTKRAEPLRLHADVHKCSGMARVLDRLRAAARFGGHTLVIVDAIHRHSLHWLRRASTVMDGNTLKGVQGLHVVEVNEDHIGQFQADWTKFYFVKCLVDPAWPWRLFEWDEIQKYLPTFAAVDDKGKLEGLIACRARQPFIKVEYLSTAPWNYGNGKLRTGVGSLLLKHAIQVGKNLGHSGALTLSSTPEAESFYETRGFVRTEVRDSEGLVVFQLPAERIARFLDGNNSLRIVEAP